MQEVQVLRDTIRLRHASLMELRLLLDDERSSCESAFALLEKSTEENMAM